MSYYNTTNLSGEELRREWANANTQEDKALLLFRRYPDGLYTPDEVRMLVFKDKIPITSVRRALTNLTKDGFLLKTEVQRKGRYGKPCYCWKLK